MDNKIIVCDIGMFQLSQVVILPDETIENITVGDLPKFLVSACEQYDTNHIHLYGNEKYINGIMTAIYEEEINQYKYNKIEIEVN